MRTNTRVKLLTITLLSQLAIASPSTQVFAADASTRAMPALTQDDRDFLKETIEEEKFDFPMNAQDKVINMAAKFLNDMRLTADMTYQEVMDKLMNEDIRLSEISESRKKPLIPGAFLDATSALFAQAATDDKDDFKVFADILKIQAKITGLKQIPVEQCIVNLRKQLDVARKRGKHYKKVYIYSDGPEYETEYMNLRSDYPDIEIVFRVFPRDIDVFFTDSYGINDGYVFIDRVPFYYEPMYAPIWYPFYSRVFVNDSYFLGFGYPYDFGGYWNGYYGAFSVGLFANWGYNRFGDRHWHDHYRDYGYGGYAARRSGGGHTAARSGGGHAAARSGGGHATARSGGGYAAARSGGGHATARSGGGHGGGGHAATRSGGGHGGGGHAVTRSGGGHGGGGHAATRSGGGHGGGHK